MIHRRCCFTESKLLQRDTLLTSRNVKNGWGQIEKERMREEKRGRGLITVKRPRSKMLASQSGCYVGKESGSVNPSSTCKWFVLTGLSSVNICTVRPLTVSVQQERVDCWTRFNFQNGDGQWDCAAQWQPIQYSLFVSALKRQLFAPVTCL